MKKLLLIAGLSLAWASSASAQCNGQSPSGYVCGNPAASQGLPAFNTITSLLDRAFGSTQGLMLNRTGSAWVATVAPSLGLNGSSGGSLVLNGATSGSATIQVQAAAGTNTLFQLPNSNGTNNQVLSTDGSGHLSWTSISGTGTVTSVGLAMPGIFTVTGSPITSAGTLTATLNTQSANLVWAGPTTGAASAPTFRSLVGADLPLPTTSSLGGVAANNAVASNWVRQINASGVPVLSQPAFTDISGSLAPSQCPAPNFASVGCVQAYAAVSHQWINAISVAGVISSTQPAFSDISGNATLAQLPSISNNSVIGNNSGVSSTPSALSASNVLDMIGGTQGQVLYRGASAWSVLSPGTAGQVLTTGGAAANPSWTSVGGTGTVTSIATNNGVTGGTITTTGTIGLATIATGNVLAYTGGGTGVPVATVPSAVLDVIGSSTGAILYRAAGGTGWQILAAGTNGQYLQQGSSTPAWANAVSQINCVKGAVCSTITTTGNVTAPGALFAATGAL